MAADPKAKKFGETDPEFTYQVSGLKFDDTADEVLEGELTREPGEAVGFYDILQGSLKLTDENPYSDYGMDTDNQFFSNYTMAYIPNELEIIALPPVPTPPAIPYVKIDPLGRPIISVANQAIVLDEPFEDIDTLALETDVGIAVANVAAISSAPDALAGIAPQSGEEEDESSPEALSEIEPAAGGEQEQQNGEDLENSELACVNNFLDDQPCESEELQ